MSLLLAVDVGNTNIVLGIYDLDRGEDAPLVHSWRLATSRERTVDEYGLSSLALLRHNAIEADQVKHVVISSVVPPLHPVLDAWARVYFKAEPLWIEPGIRTGLKVLLDNPAELGADRIVNAVAGLELYGTPLIAVDFGTATTFDVVNERREYLGGIICPGLKISAEALFQRASRLPRVEIAEPERLVGKSTVQAMQSGLFYGYVGQVDGILARLLAEYPGARVVATGGLAKVIAASSQHIGVVAPDLTLDGLRILWLKNRKAGK
ncbi:type III pantothenate kinase [Mesoterricola sediminis]|uniref:Type III pantothenate kinase n=1 Tax=Mesoterricola sediminis TaxID=2927980 RepID=A0AA48GYI2_9BACT|nr:type III pantothenate kinase [Mesoterricola sediminis]BDU76382.1 type III pantothenate kinase [Mesoterricola sediminis]